MEYLSELLQALIVDKQMVRLLFVLFVVLAIAVFCVGVAFIVSAASDPVRKRIKYFLADAQIEDEQSLATVSSKLDPVSKYLLPSNQQERNQTREQLMHAGFVSPGALGAF